MVTLTERQAREKYTKRETEADELGRLITVRLLHPSEQSRVVGMTEDLSGLEAVTTSNGTKFEMSHRAPLMLAAAVCQIDDAHVTFPRNRGELDSILDRLDADGLEAAGKALARLAELVRPPLEQLDEAKNSQGTSISAEPVG